MDLARFQLFATPSTCCKAAFLSSLPMSPCPSLIHLSFLFMFSFHSFYSSFGIFIHISFLIISFIFSMFCYFTFSLSIFNDFGHFAFVLFFFHLCGSGTCESVCKVSCAVSVLSHSCGVRVKIMSR